MVAKDLYISLQNGTFKLQLLINLVNVNVNEIKIIVSPSFALFIKIIVKK